MSRPWQSSRPEPLEQHLGLEVQWSEVDFHHSTDFKSPGFVIVTASASSLPRTQSGTSPKRGADSGLFLPGCVTPPVAITPSI